VDKCHWKEEEDEEEGSGGGSGRWNGRVIMVSEVEVEGALLRNIISIIATTTPPYPPWQVLTPPAMALVCSSHMASIPGPKVSEVKFSHSSYHPMIHIIAIKRREKMVGEDEEGKGGKKCDI